MALRRGSAASARRQPGRHPVLCTALMAAAGAATLLSSPARGQVVTIEGGLDLQLFKPTADGRGLPVTSTSDPLDHLDLELLTFFGFARAPLELAREDEGRRIAGVVDGLTTIDLAATLGVFDVATVYALVPLTLNQDRSGVLGRNDEARAGFNDLGVGTKVRLLRRDALDGLPVGAAATLELTAPSGEEGELLGAEGVTAEAGLVLDAHPVDNVRLALNTGFRLRTQGPAHINDVRIGDQITYALGVGFRPDSDRGNGGGSGRLWEISAELFGSTGRKAFFRKSRSAPAEVLLGARRDTLTGFAFNLGVGFGLNDGVGSPDYRVVMGLTFAPLRTPKDPGCPPPPACPECPTCPQCPACPPCEDAPRTQCEHEGPEDIDGFMDDDGCPDPDNDTDGVLDVDDQCPLLAEDRDGLADEDGCPETDVDEDGVLDESDQCQTEKEDKDGFFDDDGCPDPDNDADGVLDVNDRCPNAAEVFNGTDDEDGCPDELTSTVKLTADRIEILEKIFFDSGRSTIKDRSFKILREVADVLLRYPDITKMRIEGHTDSQGNDVYNRDLSQRRAQAVRAFLIGKGVPEATLVAEGFGETLPISTNATPRGREMNRRVEFVILERDGKPISKGSAL